MEWQTEEKRGSGVKEAYEEKSEQLRLIDHKCLKIIITSDEGTNDS